MGLMALPEITVTKITLVKNLVGKVIILKT